MRQASRVASAIIPMRATSARARFRFASLRGQCEQRSKIASMSSGCAEANRNVARGTARCSAPWPSSHAGVRTRLATSDATACLLPRELLSLLRLRHSRRPRARGTQTGHSGVPQELQLRDLHFRVADVRRFSNRLYHELRCHSYTWPARGGEHYQRDSTRRQILLITKIGIGGDSTSKPAASAAANISPFFRVDQPSSNAVSTVCSLSARRSGAGVP